MLCITPRTLHCLRTEGHFGLLSTFRIVTMVRFIGHTSVEDDKKKAKVPKIFQILHSEGMGSKAEIRFFLRQELFHPTLGVVPVYNSFFFQEIQLETISFREVHPLIHFIFYRDHGHGNQSVVKWAFLKNFRAYSKNFSEGPAPRPGSCFRQILSWIRSWFW